MITTSAFWALVLFQSRIIWCQAEVSAKDECQKKIAECAKENDVKVPVCGSDGVTYASQCKVILKHCQGGSIFVKHNGPCPDTAPCFSARFSARNGTRLPVCRADGRYAPVQCHQQTGYCWCVSPDGHPIPDTSVKFRKPKCRKFIRESANSYRNAQKRRSSPSRKSRRQHNNRRNNCGRVDMSKFNVNLIENFKIEYRRANISSNGDKNMERVLSWKFGTLDVNKDGYLDRGEYKELRRLARKAVRPKKCARTFSRTCDLDRDTKLSREEWGACLANDFTLLKGKTATIHSRPAFNDDPPETSEDSETTDCISDQLSVLEDQKQSTHEKFYIPQCTPDGRYHKVQCYSGYCWCVYQDTGKPIPGTSSKDLTPNCNPAPAPSRPIKGCPESIKTEFFRDLMEVLYEKIKSSGADRDYSSIEWQTTREEQVATWHFVMLDENKNKVLEKKEWKNFRNMVISNKQLRRCGKKLPKYCDINNDRKISMTEWLNCLNAQRPAAVAATEQTSTSKPMRTGPNPLDQFLNDDD